MNAERKFPPIMTVAILTVADFLAYENSLGRVSEPPSNTHRAKERVEDPPCYDGGRVKREKKAS